MLDIHNLTKVYGKKRAVDNLNLKIVSGEICSFLGPNGAGKTTTIKIASGLIRANTGKVLIDGYNIVQEPIEAKKRLALIPDRPYLYSQLTGREYLNFIARLFKLDGKIFKKRAEKYVELFNLSDSVDDLIGTFSLGMQQKLVMVSAFIREPKVIIIDEPMVGLDPKSAVLLKKMLVEKSKEEVAIFVSTHILSLAEDIADTVAVINDGKLITKASPVELARLASMESERDLTKIFLKLTEEPDFIL